MTTATKVAPFVYDDGGREAAGYKGEANDCGVRAAAIATGLPYQDVYDAIIELAKSERPRKPKVRSHPRTGVWPKTMGKFMEAHGFTWVPTMGIGTGAKVHLRADELPGGVVLARVSKHFATLIDGVIHDTLDPSRDGTRCVYGYWTREEQ